MTTTTDTPTETDAPENTQDAPESALTDEQPEPDQFPREYVEKLRRENAEQRARAKKADDLAQQLFHARVAATGRLADPSDLTFDAKLLDDHPALEAAIEDLIGRKPHLASRTPRGDVGQGASAGSEAVDLAGILRAGAF